MNNSKTKSIVIGGGITGLTAAYALSKKGHQVIIIEPGELGGLIRTEKKEGFTLEHGPNVLLSKPEIMTLIKDLNLDDQIVFPRVSKYKQMVWFESAPHAVPKGPIQFISSPLLSISDKVKLITNIFRKGLGSDIDHDTTVAQMLSKIFGYNLVKNIVDPVLKGIYGGNIEKLSASSIFPEMFAALKEGRSVFSYLKAKKGKTKRPRAFVLKDGMMSLIIALKYWLQNRVAFEYERVANIFSVEGEFIVSLDSGRRLLASNVYITTAGQSTASFIKDLNGKLAEQLNSLNIAPLVVLHISASDLHAIPKDSFGVLFPSSLNSPILGAMFNSELFPHTAPHGKQLITVCLGGSENRSVIELGDRELAKVAQEELSNRLNIKETSVLNITKWPAAIPQFERGHSELKKAIAECESSNPGLYFIGSDRGGIGVPDRVKQGMMV